MNILSWTREKLSDWRQYRAGYHRVAPAGARGRVYAPRPGKDVGGDPGKMSAEAVARAGIKRMKVIRKDGSVELYDGDGYRIDKERENG